MSGEKAFPFTEKPLESDRNWRISPHHLFGFAGLSLYAGWLFILYASPLLTQSMNTSENPIEIPHVSMMLTTILFLMFTWRFSNFFSSESGIRVLLFLGIICSPACCATPLLIREGHAFVVPALWAVTAIGYGSLILLWSTPLTMLQGTKATVFIAGAIIVGALILIFTSSLVESAPLFFIVPLPILSGIFFYLAQKNTPTAQDNSFSALSIKAAESDEKSPISWKSVVGTCTYTSCLGIALYCAFKETPYPENMICIGMATIASCIIIIIDVSYKHILTEKTQLKLFLPLAAATVFPLAVFGSTGKLIFLALIFLVFMLSFVTNLSAISECVRIFELSSIRVFSYGRAGNIFGVLLGYVVGIFAFNSPPVETIYVFAGVIFVFIIASTFFIEDHYPVSSEVGDDAVFSNQDPRNRKGSWMKRCRIVADRYNLSPRQTEVLILLAKGRNTGFIQEQLVISSHTAKAHIYNTYRKIGIHSRQELLTLIESVEIKD